MGFCVKFSFGIVIIALCGLKFVKSDIQTANRSLNGCNFTKTEFHCLYGHNNLVIESISPKQCKQECVSQTEFDCLSFDYMGGNCLLSASSKQTVPHSFGVHATAHYFEKSCVDNDTPSDNVVHCRADEFECTSRTQCISSDLMCDNNPDCSDGSDEVGCVDPCPVNTWFRCGPHGVCIPSWWVCDSTEDCLNGEDEAACGSSKLLREMMSFSKKSSKRGSCNGMKCAGAGGKERCIPKGWVCDGVWDCTDGADEQGCLREIPMISEESTKRGSCNGMKCAGTGGKERCIPKVWVCDGAWDCTDGADEQGCR